MDTKHERDAILKMLHEGQISLEEAEALLDALDDTLSSDAGTDSGRSGSAGGFREGSAKSRRGFDFDLDLGAVGREIEEAVRDAVRSVKAAVKDAGGFGDWLEGAFGSTKSVENRAFTVSAEALDKLVVRNNRGNIRLRGAQTSSIGVRAQVTVWGVDQESADRAQSSVVIDHSVETGVLTVEGRVADQQLVRRFRVDYEIEAPNDLVAELLSRSGKISAEERDAKTHLSSMSGSLEGQSLSGGVIVSTRSGSIRLMHVCGRIEANTKSGGVALTDVTGQVAVRTVSGAIRLVAADDESTGVEARSISGAVTIEDAHGDLEVDTKSGSVRITGVVSMKIDARSVSGSLNTDATLLSPCDVRLSTTSGGVRLSIANDTQARVCARTTSGGITCDLPLTEMVRTRTRVEGVLGQPAGSIEISSVSGGAHLQTRE